MNKKYGILIICVAILFLCTVGTASAKTWYVDDSGGADFIRIQDAITAASDGNTIIVYNGYYYENVIVNKQLNLIGIGMPVVDACENGSAIAITANGCILNGFNTINSSGGDWEDSGIKIDSDDNVILSMNTSNNNHGVHFSGSSNNSVTDIFVSNNFYGIIVDSSSNNNVLSNSNIKSNTLEGIYLRGGNNNRVANNDVSSNGGGIVIEGSTNEITNNNIFSNSIHGILLMCSGNNTLRNNKIAADHEGNFGVYGRNLEEYIQHIDTSNTIDEKPIYYLINEQNEQISGNAGYVGIVNSTNIIIQDLKLTKNREGVLLAYTKNSRIENVTVENNSYGIYLDESSGITLINNTAANSRCGIYLDSSGNNTLVNNIMSENTYNFGVHGNSLSHYIQNIGTSNKVDGKPVYYLVEQENQQVPNDAGFVGIVNSLNITVSDLTLTKNRPGVLLAFSNNSRIENVNISDTGYSGIHLWHSRNNTLNNNTVSNNDWYGISLDGSSDNVLTKNNIKSNCLYGIYLEFSNNNKIYLNNLIHYHCGYNIGSSDSANIWKSTEKITYIYNGSTHINYLGNYWDDYKEKYPDAEEIDSTGIWNTSYSIDSENDSYPLIEPFENYFIYPKLIPDKIEITTKVRAGETVIHYENRSFWKESDFLEILENKEEFKFTTIENFNESLSKYGKRGEYATNIKVEFDDARKSTTLRCDIHDAITKSDDSYRATFIWLLRPLGLDFIVNNFEGSKNGLSWRGTINEVSTNISLEFPPQESAYAAWELPNGYCHGHVWWTITVYMFDTGPGTYPSISGTYNGTITPNQTIEVSKLYTYPCIGTGGHTEYAKIYNDSLSVETLPWEGYKGDWHNISFNQSFTLVKNKTYNYTIVTGSYPQIHHTDELEVASGTGTITCDKFVDANGRVYYDWIPAIRLE